MKAAADDERNPVPASDRNGKLERSQEVTKSEKKPVIGDLTRVAARDLAKLHRACIRQTTAVCHNREKSLPPQKPRCTLQKSCQSASPCGSLLLPVLARARAKGLRPRC